MVRVWAWTRCTVDIAQGEGMAPKVNNPQDVILLTGGTRARLDFLGRKITLLSLPGVYLVCLGVWVFGVLISDVEV